VLLNTLGYYDALLKLLRGAVGEGFVSASCLDLIALASTPGEALSLALSPRAHSARSIADYGK
jgi:predicted Rossmann-fold nucleotide-binding protein